MDRLLGVDVSFWQIDRNVVPWVLFDWRKPKTAGAHFAWIRAGQGRYKDVAYNYNWPDSRESGLPRGAYWFYEWRPGLDPGPRQQAELLLDITRGDVGEMGIALDFERPSSAWPALPPREDCLNRIQIFYDTLARHHVKADVFYTNPDFLKNKLGYNYPVWLRQKKLWLAWYPTWYGSLLAWLERHLQTGLIPVLPETKWPVTFWQFTDRLNGPQFGSAPSCKQIDGNYFFGSRVELDAFCGGTPQPEPEPQPGGEIVKLIVKAAVNIRTRPSTTNSSVIGVRQPGQIVNAVEIKVETPRRIWARDALGWSAIVHDSSPNVIFMDGA